MRQKNSLQALRFTSNFGRKLTRRGPAGLTGQQLALFNAQLADAPDVLYTGHDALGDGTLVDWSGNARNASAAAGGSPGASVNYAGIKCIAAMGSGQFGFIRTGLSALQDPQASGLTVCVLAQLPSLAGQSKMFLGFDSGGFVQNEILFFGNNYSSAGLFGFNGNFLPYGSQSLAMGYVEPTPWFYLVWRTRSNNTVPNCFFDFNGLTPDNSDNAKYATISPAPLRNQMTIGFARSAGSCNGHLANVAVYPSYLSDARIAAHYAAFST